MIDTIETARFPLFIPEMAFFALLRKQANEPEKFKVRISLSAGPSTVGTAEVQVDFLGLPNSRIIVNFQGLPITEPRNLRVSMTLPGDENFEFEVPVLQTAPAPKGAVSESAGEAKPG